MCLIRSMTLLVTLVLLVLITTASRAGTDLEKSNQLLDVHVDKVQVELKSQGKQEKGEDKDAWDKFSSISTFLSGIIVALIGIYATSVYNARQLDAQKGQKEREIAVLRVQTVEKFIPHLASDDPKVTETALDSIAALGDEELATSLAARFRGEGGASALASLSRSQNPGVARDASRALGDRFAVLRRSIFVFQSGSPATVLTTGFFVSSDGVAVVPAFAVMNTPYLVRLPDSQKTYEAELVQKSDKESLALVRIALHGPVVPISTTDADVSLGDEIVALGYTPESEVPWLGIAGIVTGLAPGQVITDLGTRSGMGGAPVVNTRSELVGMAVAKNDQGSTLVVPTQTIRSLLGS